MTTVGQIEKKTQASVIALSAAWATIDVRGRIGQNAKFQR